MMSPDDVIWNVQFNTLPVITAFFQPRGVVVEERRSPDYYFEGRGRRSTADGLFQYTLAGEGRFWDAQGIHRLPPGTGFLCEPCDPETGYCYPGEGTAPWRFMFIGIKGGRDAIRQLVQRFGGVYQVPLDAPPIRRLLAFERYSSSVVDLTPGEAMNLIAGLLGALADAGVSQHRASTHAGLIREARRLVAAHLNECFNVAAMADRLGVSAAHLCRVFHAETGSTPLQYLARERMRLACELLQRPSLSIKEIAFELGYDNSSHFSRAFRRVTGVTPGQFRRNPSAILMI